MPVNSEKQNKAYVHFVDQNKASIKIDLNTDRKALDKFVRVNEDLDVAHKISHVDIFIHFANLDDNIVLVDTPGMNGVADGHRNITLNEIQHSNASICLFHLKGIGKTDLNFIKELMKYQDKFFFVLNGIDDLKLAEGESYESRLNSFKEELKRSLPKLTQKNVSVYGLSALNALVSKDKSIKRLYENDTRDLSDEDRRKCWERSKFDIFEKDLYSFLESDEKSNHFYISLLVKLSSLLADKIDSISTSLQINDAEIEACPERKALIKMRDTMTVKIEQLIIDIEKHLGAKMDDLENLSRKMMKDEVNVEINTLRDIVNRLDYTNINQFVENRMLQKGLESFYGSITNKLSSYMSDNSELIYKELISKMRNAMPRVMFENNKISVSETKTFNDSDARFESSDIINRLQDKIKQFDKRYKDSEIELREAQSVQNKMYRAESELREAKNDRDRQIRSMGSRPSAVWKEETYYRPRRGFFSSITNAIFGDKEDTRCVEDDSRGREWDREMNEIKRKTNQRITYLQKNLDALENSNYNVNPQYIEQTRQRILTEKECAEEELRRTIVQKKQEMEYARTSAVKNRKKVILEDIDKHLCPPKGFIYTILSDGIHNYTTDTQKKMSADLNTIYQGKKKEFISQLNLMIKKTESGPNEEIQNNTIELNRQKNILIPILDKINNLIK